MLLNHIWCVFLFLSLHFLNSNSALNDDLLSLIAFKSGLTDPNSKLTSWDQDDDTPCKNWVGIQCDPETNRVTEIVLNGFSLSGHIGVKSLVMLQSLKVLSLSNNNLTGTISPILAQLESLAIIDFSHNSLTGSIPDELFQKCSSLRLISVANNNLSGKIPESLSSCSMFEGIDFSSNQLSGSLPYGIWSLMTRLQSIDLSRNFLGGEIPRGIGGLFDMRSVNLSRNNFTGNLPEDIGNCLLLESLDLSQNSLSGTLPESMQKLSLCTSLVLCGNMFSGEIPSWVGNMQSLESLDLSRNNFSDQIPSSIGNLHFLKELNLSLNNFIGNLPESLVNCVNLSRVDFSRNSLTGNFSDWIFKSGLEVLDLSSNVFSGEIGDFAESSRTIRVLNLSRNSFTGHIPVTIGELKYAEVIDLSVNLMNGNIPIELGGAISLEQLWIHNNFLNGSIPDDIGNCSCLISLVLSRNILSGPIPASLATLTNLQTVDFTYNNLSGTLPKELANLPNLETFNVSHNSLKGEIPVGGFFDKIPISSISNNPSLCGSTLNRSCPAVHPKPIVLNPNSQSSSRNSFRAPFHRKRFDLSASSFVAIGGAVFIFLGVVIVVILNYYVRVSIINSSKSLTITYEEELSCSISPISDSNRGKLVMFSGEVEFVLGTNLLLEKSSEIGRGGFGTVYLTQLDGRLFAIKKLNLASLKKSQGDFEHEIMGLGRIRHRNLVSVEGYYWAPTIQLVVSAYVCRGSLYKLLHERKTEDFLSWKERYNIVLGVAKGLAHLHQMKIIHYNLKSSNILIDDNGETKVGDFGLVSLLTTLDRYVLSTKVQSCLGYVAPEFSCKDVKITEKYDVYGFGILVLEVVSGKRPVEYMEDDVAVLCDAVRSAVENGRGEECVDRGLFGNFVAEEAISVLKLGLMCASQVPSNRPHMDEVVKTLELIEYNALKQE